MIRVRGAPAGAELHAQLGVRPRPAKGRSLQKHQIAGVVNTTLRVRRDAEAILLGAEQHGHRLDDAEQSRRLLHYLFGAANSGVHRREVLIRAGLSLSSRCRLISTIR